MVEIVPYEPDMAAGLACCYNGLMAPVPYHHPAAEDWFRDLRPAEFQSCTEEAVLVALEDGQVVGFTHVGISAPPTHKWHIKGEPGVIRFLSYRPGERAVGAALLEAAERWLWEHERTKIVAGFSGYMYPFYPLPGGHISDRISHVPPLFGMAGYAVPESEVLFHWLDYQPPEVPRPDVEFELACEAKQTDQRGLAVTIRAMQGDRQVGECNMSSLRGDPWRPQFADWCVSGELLVAEAMQGRGLGKYLHARGLAEMRRDGCRHAMISTDWNNYRAYLFYTNFGYSFLDRTSGFGRDLG